MTEPRPRDILRILTAWYDAFDRSMYGPNPGGAPAGTGLTIAALVAKAIERREADGTWPTQEVVAEALGLSVRRVRDVGRPHGGWRGVVSLADAELAARAPGFSAGSVLVDFLDSGDADHDDQLHVG